MPAPPHSLHLLLWRWCGHRPPLRVAPSAVVPAAGPFGRIAPPLGESLFWFLKFDLGHCIIVVHELDQVRAIDNIYCILYVVFRKEILEMVSSHRGARVLRAAVKVSFAGSGWAAPVRIVR